MTKFGYETCLTASLWLVVIVTSTAKADDVYRGADEPITAEEIYGQGVRETDWRSPADEAAGFHLPPGFVAELVASEPDIAKPINMAFDHRGRLWVSSTLEYPYPAKEGAPARDSIKILEDTDGDGNYDSVKTFADGLNIPMGLLPVSDGVIAFSIPYLWHFKDVDGDDQVDERIKLLGPFDTTRDTHGMINALRMGVDGWVYACHGFNNQSDVSAADGSRVQMNSGNTFRFRPDGSRIEIYTNGQVNPFGMTSDEWGNWYTADCHSKPLTALLAGAYYESFGRPHDGLGFAPTMMNHLHGSTAICGVEYYQADQFPPEYRHLFYSGNVMTSRINCNRSIRSGMTVAARELPDFLTSDDPWFRPSDLRVGPDGCLYIADFYNKIIGHYEVPLEHPERDRTSGRIWRIRYVGLAPEARSTDRRKMAKSISPFEALGSSNFPRRSQAIESEFISPTLSGEQLEKLAGDPKSKLELRLSTISLLARRNELSVSKMLQLLASGVPETNSLVLRIACGWTIPLAQDHELMLDAASTLLSNDEPEVVRPAIELLSRFGDRRFLPALANIANNTEVADPVRFQATRIAIRNILHRDEAALELIAERKPSFFEWKQSPDAKLIMELLPGIASPKAAQALLQFISDFPPTPNDPLAIVAIDHASRYPSSALTELLVTSIERLTENDPEARASRIVQIANLPGTISQRAPSLLGKLAEKTTTELLALLDGRVRGEGPSMIWLDQSGQPWGVESRRCADGKNVELLSSLTRGEQYTGILTSEPFLCPPSLSFWIAGHNGFPNKDDHRRNRVRLVSSPSEQVLAEALPPKNDTAVEVVWDLSKFAGQDVVLQIVDGDASTAFAWLGVCRFSIPELQVGSTLKLIEATAQLAKRGFSGNALEDKLDSIPLSARQRAMLIAATLEADDSPLTGTLASQAIALGRPQMVTRQFKSTPIQKTVEELCRSTTASQQSTFARALLKSADGCTLLAQAIDAGWLNVSSLRGAPALLPDSLTPETKQRLASYFDAAQASGMDASIVATRLSELNWSQADASRGRQVFKQQCSNCHQLQGEGTTVGPQLDGAVQRGAQRLAEDILLPNLNVDRAFRVTIFLLDDDSIATGKVLDENDQTIQLVGSDGKPYTISAAEVVQRRESDQSLMPSNLADLLSNEQLADLLQFLTTSK